MIKIPASTLINKPDRARKQLYAIVTRAVSDYQAMKDHRPAHLDYLNRLDSNGILVGAGPTLNHDGTFYEGDGLIIVRAGSLAEASDIAGEDPFHLNNVREYVLYPWLLSEGNMMEQLL